MMNLRWIWGDFMDPGWALDRRQRREVHRIAHEKYIRPAVLYGSTALFVVAGIGVASQVIDPLAHALAGLGTFYAWVTSFALIATTIIIGSAWCYRFIYIRPIRRAMRDLGYDVCIRCGYWLKGLDDRTPNCPECGEARPVDESSPSPTV